MSKVLVRKQQVFDAKQAANNMATVSDLSNSGTIEQLGLLNLLSGPQKPLAPAAAEKLGYDMDSKQYKRLRTGERIGQGLAGAYSGFRALDALASGRSPTSAIGAGAGAYGSVAPIASRVGVRAASRGMKPAEPAPEKTRQTTLDEFSDVKPPVIVKPSTPAASPAAAASSVAVVKPPSPLETQAHGLKPGQTVFGTEYAGPAQPARVKVVEPTVAMNPPDKNMLSYGAQIKPAEGSQTATTQSQQGQPPTNQQKQTLSRDPFETKLIDYVNNAEREKQLEQARRDQSEQSSNVLPSSDIDGI
jgi:hypothetical protein